MAVVTLPTRPVAPEQPWELRRLIQEHNRAVATWRKVALAGLGAPLAGYAADIKAARELVRGWWVSPAGREHRAAIAAYSEAAEHFNRELQARANAREGNQARARSCGTCFTVLPTSGICGEC